MIKIKTNVFFIILTLWAGFALFPAGIVTEVHNTKKEIDTCMGKVQLTLVRTWGGDEEENFDRIFKNPMDVVVDKNGFIYICDFGRHRIQVFDNVGNFKRTIGRRGNGPADFLNPDALALDIQGNLVVSDRSNYRIQVLTPEGKYIGGFKFLNGFIFGLQSAHKKNEIVLFSHKKTFFSKKLLFIYNPKGKPIREIGKYVNTGKENISESESILFTMDDNDNIYTAYYGTPYLLVFSYIGDISTLITYEMPYEAPTARFDKSKTSIEIEGKAKGGATYALSVDTQRKIYIVTPKRLKTDEEIKNSGLSSVARPGGESIIKRKKIDSENTDLYRLLVFDSSGKVIAGALLNVFCDKIYIHNNRLFIIDRFKAMKIYEYKITFR